MVGERKRLNLHKLQLKKIIETEKINFKLPLGKYKITFATQRIVLFLNKFKAFSNSKTIHETHWKLINPGDAVL